LDEKISLHPLDPEEGLRKLLQQPPLNQRDDEAEEKPEPNDDP
jgi:hypothetical protein